MSQNQRDQASYTLPISHLVPRGLLVLAPDVESTEYGLVVSGHVSGELSLIGLAILASPDACRYVLECMHLHMQVTELKSRRQRFFLLAPIRSRGGKHTSRTVLKLYT